MKSGSYILLVLTVLLLPSEIRAQKIRTEKGEYTYYPPETQSMEVARQTAIERAKLQILADTFGTTVSQTATTRISDGSASTSALSSSSVRGEWLETVSGPDIETMLSPDGMIGIKVRIVGKVREISASKTDIQAAVLRNGLDNRFASTEFKAGDDMYLSFTSPESGFALAYLYDGEEEVYCLLPYSTQSMSAFPIEAQRPYVFFSADKPDGVSVSALVDEYTLTCSRQQELNRIYVLFSPNHLSRAVDVNAAPGSAPRSLSYASFQRWLGKVRTEDRELVVREFDITIDR